MEGFEFIELRLHYFWGERVGKKKSGRERR